MQKRIHKKYNQNTLEKDRERLIINLDKNYQDY